MKIFLYTLFTSIFCVDWLADKLQLLPHGATYYAELYATMIMLAVALIASQRRKFDINPKIAVILFFVIAAFLASVISNKIPAGVLVGGIRIHLKFLPFLILPMVYQFSDTQIRQQLSFVLALTLIQAPVALYQRFVKYAATSSGDPVGGTLGANASGILSIWLACVITIVFSFYLTKIIRRRTLIILLIALVSPMMINETKISFLLIPLALIIPAVFSNRGGNRTARIAMTAGATFTLFLALVTVYDMLKPNKSILEWFATDDAAGYVYQGTTTGGARKNVKRLDTIRIAYTKLQYENSVVFGLGPGNLSPAFDRRYEGKYFRRYEQFQPKKVQISLSLWETGVAGTSLIIALMLGCGIIGYRLKSKNQNDQYQALALGWIGVTTILFISLFYISVLTINIFAIFYWFYSGVIIAKYARTQANGHRSAESLGASTK